MERNFEKLPNGAKYGPCVDVTIGGEVVPCRIDTGADVSVLPSDVLARSVTMGGQPINLIRGINKPTRISTYAVTVEVEGKTIHLSQVVAHDCPYGLAGMDIISHFSLLMINSVVILE